MEVTEDSTEHVVPGEGQGVILDGESITEFQIVHGNESENLDETSEVVSSDQNINNSDISGMHDNCSNDSGKLVMVENEFILQNTQNQNGESSQLIIDITGRDQNKNDTIPTTVSSLGDGQLDLTMQEPSKSTSDLSVEKEKADSLGSCESEALKGQEENEMSEEDAHNILKKALEKIGPKIGKDFVLMFKDPSTSEVRELSSDKGKKFLEHNTDIVQKFSSICSDEKIGDKVSENDNMDVIELQIGDDSKSGAEVEDTLSKKEVMPLKRTPRTTVMMKKIAKLDEKERLKESQNYSCEHCPSKFGTLGNLNKHLKNKHNLGWEGKRGPKVKETDTSSASGESTEGPELDEKNTQSEHKEKTIRIKDFGDFEAIVTTPENINTPVNTEVKRGRGRPPKNKSLMETPEGNSSNTPRPVGRPRKNTSEPTSSESSVEFKKPDVKMQKNSSKQYTDEDIDCFIGKHDEQNSRMNLECKLCLLKFSSHRMAREHVDLEHKQNLLQCLRTLDLYPDTNKSSRFDKYIYIIEDDVKEGFIPSELFNMPGRAGRKRTPSKKYLESQNSLIKNTYVCKICHRKASNKTSMLQHMNKFHMSVLPAETKETNDEEVQDQVEEEEEEEEVMQEEEEEEESELEEDDEDKDYKPPPKIIEEESDSEKSQSRGLKRKQDAKSAESSAKKNKTDEKNIEIPKMAEVHVKIEVIPENQHVMNGSEGNVNENKETSKEPGVFDVKEEIGDENLAIKRRRSRIRPVKKIPSYYVYCDHGEESITRTTSQNLPFCKLCDRFKCVICTLTFKKSSHINRHVRIIHQKEKKYKCAKCDARFTTNESLQYHKKWHLGIKDVECPHCSMKFLVHKNLRKHMAKHHPGMMPVRKKKTNHCEICNSIFSRKERLEYHMLEKHPANNPDKECRICGQKFETEEECFSHADAHADMKKVPVAKCPHCDLYCSSKNNLKRHVDRVHLNIKKYLCNECGKRFKGRDAFIYHTKRHADPTGRDFECHICQKKIATEKGLEIHLRTHTGLKPYVCETCGKGFSQKGNMISHQAIHFEDRPFECEECHKTFKKKFDLYKHMKRHKIHKVAQTGDLSHLEGAGKVYECPMEDCNVLFCSTNDLKLHLRKHTNERPFECTICNKNFAVKSRLVRHLRNVHNLNLPESDLKAMNSPEFIEIIDKARATYHERKSKYQTVVIPQPSGEQIEVQIMTEDTEGVEDLLALANPTTFNTVKNNEKEENNEEEGEEITFKIETSEEEGSNVQIINVREDDSGEVQIHTEDDNIVLDPAIIQTLLNSGQQTIYYYVDQ